MRFKSIILILIWLFSLRAGYSLFNSEYRRKFESF